MDKLEKAIKRYRPGDIALAAGFSANSELREKFAQVARTPASMPTYPPLNTAPTMPP